MQQPRRIYYGKGGEKKWPGCRVDDAIAASAAGEEQTGARYEVKYIKHVEQTTGVKNWK